ncbi:MAG TPA: hypothetical protein VK850_13575 [Candidatus Binatia bacterium]|nr:hypothetical protein [Candidatus Binatia bacterium]
MMRRGVVFSICLVLVLVSIFWQKASDRLGAERKASANAGKGAGADSADRQGTRRVSVNPAPAGHAEQIVAAKVVQFGRNRRELLRAIAWRTGKEIPGEVEKFFEAIESGNWEEIEAVWTSMSKRSGQYEGSTHAPELDPFWPTVLDVYLTAEAAHNWPAQKLLDYGNSILGALRPGMVYVGGTDSGRAIPTLMNETGEGEHHIVVTQNAFADRRYMEFVETLYSDRFAALTTEESDRAFAAYIDDAKKRFDHDRQFPDEPKQVRPGETVGMENGKFQVSGQVAVMDINERMLRMLMEKNPEMSFAMEESFPFKAMMGNATTLGPIMELGVQDEQQALTRERAAQAVDYWRATTQELLSDSDAMASHEVRMSYSKLISSQAGMLLDRGYTAEAEEAFVLANKIAPTSAEAVTRYVDLLINEGRVGDAIPIAENARSLAPEKKEFSDLVQKLQTLKK